MDVFCFVLILNTFCVDKAHNALEFWLDQSALTCPLHFGASVGRLKEVNMCLVPL